MILFTLAILALVDDGPLTAARFREHAAYLASDELEGRGVGTPGGAKAVEYIAGKFRAFGLEKPGGADGYFQDFQAGKDRGRNVVGVLPGRGALGEEYLVVAAHWDHLGTFGDEANPQADRIYNGADDNASGVAAMLMIAEALTSDAKGRPESHRGILFIAFDAEEQGLTGSRYYVEHPLRPLAKTVGILNLDMVGRLRGDTLYASDSATSPAFVRNLKELEKELGLRIETRGGGAGRSDQANFIERGVPGIQFQTGIHGDYHLPSDELGTLNLEGGARVADVVARLVRRTISEPKRPPFEPLDPAYDIRHLLGIVQRLGIIPEVNTQAGRYPKLVLIVPGSPAAKAGLKGGDQVVAFNGKSFGRVEDAIAVFAELRFDRDIKLTVLRGDEKKDLVIFASDLAAFAGPKIKALENGDYEVLFKTKPPRGVSSVYLAGTFNDWKKDALKMDGPDAAGMFSARLVLKKGAYEYKFVDDGKTWRTDPDNMQQVGAFRNSLFRIGD